MVEELAHGHALRVVAICAKQSVQRWIEKRPNRRVEVDAPLFPKTKHRRRHKGLGVARNADGSVYGQRNLRRWIGQTGRGPVRLAGASPRYEHCHRTSLLPQHC